MASACVYQNRRRSPWYPQIRHLSAETSRSPRASPFGRPQYFLDLFLMPALIIVIAKYANDRNAAGAQIFRKLIGFLWQPKVREVSTQGKNIRGLRDLFEKPLEGFG